MIEAGRRIGRGNQLPNLLGHRCVVGNVESHGIKLRKASGKHLLRRLRIDIDIELSVSMRLDVPRRPERSTHDDQPLDQFRQLGFDIQRDSQIRQRSETDQRDLARPLMSQRHDRRRTAKLSNRSLAPLQLRAANAVASMRIRGGEELSNERSRRTPIDRYICRAEHVQHIQRVSGRLVDRRIAGDGRNRDELGIRRMDRQRDRCRVIDSRVDIEHDGNSLGHRARLASLARFASAAIHPATGGVSVI